MCLCWKGGWVERWVWMGVGCPCPPVRNDIVTPRHLLIGTLYDHITPVWAVGGTAMDLGDSSRCIFMQSVKCDSVRKNAREQP